MRYICIFMFMLMPFGAAQAGEWTTPAGFSDELGLSLGTPGGINLVYHKATEERTYRLAVGGLGPKSYGIEVGATLIRNPGELFRSLQVIAGASSIRNNVSPTLTVADRWVYGGLSTTFQYGGFFVEPGLTVGVGDYTNPQFILQVGWLWEL